MTETNSKYGNCGCAQELEKMEMDDLMQKQVEQLDKEKKELMARLKNQEKKVKLNHLYMLQILV